MKRPVAAVVALVIVAALAGGTLLTSGGHQATVSCRGYVTQYGCQAHSPTFGLPPTGLTLLPRSATPTAAMYDSVVVSTVPANPPAVAGYVAGNFITFGPLVAAFPHAVHVPIAIQADEIVRNVRMACLDVEPGDAVPAQAGGWARAELNAGVIPCEYANLSTYPQVRASLAAAGIPRSKTFEWDADWTFSPHLDSGFDATQWTDHALNRNLDASAATLQFLGLAPKPVPALPVCITHRITRSACVYNKAHIAQDQRAAASSQRAWVARGCPVLSQRVSWFGTQLRKHPKVKTASRKRALAASKRAYAKQSCSTYKHRVVFFSAAAAKLKAAS